MQHIIQRNERRARQSAFWLAVTLHLALGAFIYFQAGEKPTPKPEVTQTTQTASKTYTTTAKTKPLPRP